MNRTITLSLLPTGAAHVPATYPAEVPDRHTRALLALSTE